MSTASAACTVYFDGACPLCRREIAHYRRRTSALPIAWVDASACDPAALGADLPRSAALTRLHVRTADGALVSGAAAFAALWARVPGYRWLAAVATLQPAMAAMEAAYRAFLRLRPLWRSADAAAPAAAEPNAVPAAAVPAVDTARTATRLVAVIDETAARARPVAMPRRVLADLRTDHAVEVGAVQFYRGVLAMAADGDLRAFAARRLAAQHLHLQRIRRWLPRTERSRLLPLWRAAGWLAGAVPALLGPRAVRATVAAFERAVDRRYRQQLERLAVHPDLAELRAALAARRRSRSDGVAANHPVLRSSARRRPAAVNER